MQITITPAGGSPTTLVSGPDDTGAAGYATGPLGPIEVDGEFAQQVAPRLRATVPGLYDRGNAQGVLRFGASRTFASVLAAYGFAADHVLTCPRAGTLTLSEGGSSWTAVGILSLAPKVTGIEVSIEYAFRFNAVTGAV